MFNLDVIADEEARRPFDFVLGGITWRLPHVADLEVGQSLAVEEGRFPVVARMVGLRVRDDGTAVPDGDGLAEAVLHLKSARLGKLLAAWLSHAGVAPGESGASSTSSSGTARR